MNTIEFECISKMNNDVKIAGYVFVDDLDDDVTDMYFYDHQGLECGSYVPSNPYKDGALLWCDAYEELSSAFQSDEMFMQFLADFSDEDKIVDRGDYLLKINEGVL